MTSEVDSSGLPFTYLAHYQIVAQLGRGSLGSVYRGFEPALGRSVAIKVLPAALAAKPPLLKRYLAEAAAVAKLEHPNVIPIYFIGADQGQHFVAMEFVEGESLEQLLSRRQRLSSEETVPILEQCLLGLQAAHQMGIVHRDVRPASILLDRKRGQAVLAEFGLANSLEAASRMTSTSFVLGTADYLAPEQPRREDLDARSDLYSLGIVAYQMLAGRLPFRGEGAVDLRFQHAHVPPPRLSEIAPEVPEILASIIHRMIAKAPPERYQSAAAAYADLQAFRTGSAEPIELAAAVSAPRPAARIRQAVRPGSLMKPFRELSPSVKLFLAMGLFIAAGALVWNRHSLPERQINEPNRPAAPFRPESRQPAMARGTAADTPSPPPMPSPSEAPSQPPPMPSPPTGEALAELQQAFALPAAQLVPGVVVFPPTDRDHRVRADGAGLAVLAMTAAAYGPQRRMQLDPRRAGRIMLDAGLFEPGAELDEPAIQKCLAAIGTQQYVLATLEEAPGAWRIALSLRGGGSASPDRDVACTVGFRRLADAPGEIARALLGWLGVEIDVPPAQVASNEDCASLSDLLRQRQRPDATDGTLHGLTARNRQCALAWALFLEGGPAAAEKLQWFTNWSRSVESEFLAFGLARQERDQGRAVNALRKLLPLANTHRDDAWYYRELALAAIRLDNAILIEEILKHWKQNAPGYEGHLTRGTFLADWSWQTMAGDVATAEDRTKALFRERLEMARAELDRAVSLNPLDWLAHTQLLRVAVGLGLPRQYLDKHFNEATQIQPRSIEAYRYKFMYLEPRWHGKPGELLAFSRECTATGCWSEGIPQLLIEAVQRFCFDEKTGRFDYGPTQRPEIWEAALSLYQSAQTFGRPQDKRLATNFLILCGVRGGHVRELSLVLPKSEEPRDLTTFRDACDYEYARELIAAQSQPPEPLAAIRLALGAADFEGASQILTESTRGADALFPELESRCRAAMQLGKKLHAEKSVELSPVDILDSFTGAFSTYGHVEGDGVICHVVREATALFPIGLRNGVITGVLEWSPELTTVELLLHTRAQRDILHVIYWPNRGIVQLRRNNVFLQEATCPVGPCRFRVEFGPQVDLLEPVPGVTWEVPAEDAGPSGFGFRAAVRDQAGTFTLSKVKIELRD